MTTLDVLRTPDERFDGLHRYPWQPKYVELDGLRMAYLDEGPADSAPILMLHGEPTWSYLYRKMIAPLVKAGHRVLVPDLIGFGRSDKPTRLEDYSYQAHMDWLLGWIKQVDADNMTLVCQDWGSLLGLRLAAENSERFARIFVANGFLVTGDRAPNRAFRMWKTFALKSPWFPIDRIVGWGSAHKLSKATRRAYRAPYPDARYKAGARAFPRLVPVSPEDPAAGACRAAWDELGRWEKPFLTCFGDKDPIFGRLDKYLHAHVPGCEGQSHTRIAQAGHFIQEDAGAELAAKLNDWLKDSAP